MDVSIWVVVKITAAVFITMLAFSIILCAIVRLIDFINYKMVEFQFLKEAKK